MWRLKKLVSTYALNTANGIGWTKLDLFPIPLANRNKITSTGMAALHCTTSRSGRIQTNLVVVPSANSDQFERFCELNKGTCPLLYRSGPGDVTAASLAIDTDIRYVKYVLCNEEFGLPSQPFVLHPFTLCDIKIFVRDTCSCHVGE